MFARNNYYLLMLVLVLRIRNKTIQKMELTSNITERDLKISQVEDVQFCCSSGFCKNK